jgi:hypothetical protein
MEQYNEFYKEDIAYKMAKDKIKEIKGFYINLMCYVIVIPVLIYINFTYSPEIQWFWFSAVGWGSGVLLHGMFAFGYIPFLGKDWENRKLKELMDKDAKKQ